MQILYGCLISGTVVGVELRVPTAIRENGTVFAHQDRLSFVFLVVPDHDVALEHHALAQENQISVWRKQRRRENLMGHPLQQRLYRCNCLQDAHRPERCVDHQLDVARSDLLGVHVNFHHAEAIQQNQFVTHIQASSMLLSFAEAVFRDREVTILVAILNRMDQHVVQFSTHLCNFRIGVCIVRLVLVRAVWPPSTVGYPQVMSQPRKVTGEEHSRTMHRVEMSRISSVLGYFLIHGNLLSLLLERPLKIKSLQNKEIK